MRRDDDDGPELAGALLYAITGPVILAIFWVALGFALVGCSDVGSEHEPCDPSETVHACADDGGELSCRTVQTSHGLDHELVRTSCVQICFDRWESAGFCALHPVDMIERCWCGGNPIANEGQSCTVDPVKNECRPDQACTGPEGPKVGTCKNLCEFDGVCP